MHRTHGVRSQCNVPYRLLQSLSHRAKNLLRVHSHWIKAEANFYRPQRSCGQGNVFTRVCVILFTGGSASVHAGIPSTPPHLPPPEGGPPEADTSPGSRHTPREADPPGSRHPPGSRPPKKQTLPPGSRPPPRHTVNERPVRILLECILFSLMFVIFSLIFSPHGVNGPHSLNWYCHS